MTAIVLVHDILPGRWCALRAAHPGGLIVTTCLLERAYSAVHLMVARDNRLPANMCPACKRHVEIALHGTCAPVEPAASCGATRNLRARSTTHELEWSESAAPEVALDDLLSRGVHG